MAKRATKRSDIAWKGIKMICIDSNIIIYFSQKEKTHLRKWLQNKKLAISVISEIEVLGYKYITPAEIRAASHFFTLCQSIFLSRAIVQKAIELRQAKKINLGDAIIAATAIVEDIPLLTANAKDFKHLKDLRLIDLEEI